MIRAQQETTYHRVYHETLKDIRSRIDSGVLSPEEFRGMLRTLYVQDGNDWLGRGEAEQTILSATIAAFETVLHDPEDPRVPQ